MYTSHQQPQPQQQQQQPLQTQGFSTGSQQQQQPLSQSVPSQGPSGASYGGIPSTGGSGAALHHLSDSSMNNGQVRVLWVLVIAFIGLLAELGTLP
jgi:hypothetical protein